VHVSKNAKLSAGILTYVKSKYVVFGVGAVRGVRGVRGVNRFHSLLLGDKVHYEEKGASGPLLIYCRRSQASTW
jgi:hypothetical protein